MAVQYSVTHRTNAMTQLATDVGTSAVIKIWTGTVPANCGTTDSGTLLVTFAGNVTQFGTAAAGVLTVSAIANAVAGNTGTAGYFRVYPSAATGTNAVMQGTVGVDMTLTNTSITSGQTCAWTSMTVTAFGV